MPDSTHTNPTEDINFKKTLQTEQKQKERRQKMLLIVVILIIFAILIFLYQQSNQPEIQTEVLPNTSLTYLNK